MPPRPPVRPAPAAPDEATPPPFGRPGALDAQPDGSGVRCHGCGRYFANLAQHARLAHRLWADDYRQRFGLNRATPLVAPRLSRAPRRRGLARQTGANGPHR